MYLLKYLENSNTCCEATVTPYASNEDCIADIRAAYENMKNSLGIRDEDLPASEKDDESGQYSGWISTEGAYLRAGIDSYRWEVLSLPDFIPAKGVFIVNGTYHDLSNGCMYFCRPVICFSRTEARNRLRRVFEEKLKEYGLEENDACNEKGESIPGGCFCDDEAMIYEMAPYACNCLVEVASFIVSEVELVDAAQEKDSGQEGRFVSVWSDNVEVSSPCKVDFSTGKVTVTGPNDCVDESALDNLIGEYVEVGGRRYRAVNSSEHDWLIERGDLNRDGKDKTGKSVLWY